MRFDFGKIRKMRERVDFRQGNAISCYRYQVGGQEQGAIVVAKGRTKGSAAMPSLPVRMPSDWRSRITQRLTRRVRRVLGVSDPERGHATFIRSVLRPVLDGTWRPVFDESGNVVRFERVENPKGKPVSDPVTVGRPSHEDGE